MRQSLASLGVLALACGTWLTLWQPAQAARYVEFVISLDGKTVLFASRGDQGEHPDIVWRYLKDLPLRPVKGYVVQPDEGDPAQATLRGKIRISSTYGGEVEVTALRLIRDPEGRSAWKVAPAEVERTLKIRRRPK